MEYTRIRSYRDGKWTGCEQIYARDQAKALEMFRREYTAHSDCILIAEAYDPAEDPAHFKACQECGCVHYWR